MNNQKNPIWIEQMNCRFNTADNRLNKDKIQRVFKALEYNEKHVEFFSSVLKKYNLIGAQLTAFKGLEFYYFVGITRSKLTVQIRSHDYNEGIRKRLAILSAKRKMKRNKGGKRLQIIKALEHFFYYNTTMRAAASLFNVSEPVLSVYITAYFKRPEKDMVLQSKINIE